MQGLSEAAITMTTRAPVIWRSGWDLCIYYPVGIVILAMVVLGSLGFYPYELFHMAAWMTWWLSSEHDIQDQRKSYNDFHVLDVPYFISTILHSHRGQPYSVQEGAVQGCECKEVRIPGSRHEGCQQSSTRCLQWFIFFSNMPSSASGSTKVLIL